MAKLLVMMLGLALSQGIADCIQEAGPDPARAWCQAVFAQYLVCFALLVLIEHTPFSEALVAAAVATWLVRMFYLCRRS
jgi:hypothetical protein